MTWVISSEFTLSDRNTLSLNINPGQGAQFVGIQLNDVSPNSYMRYGYLWVLAPITIGSVVYQTRISVGSVWFASHRYPVAPPSIITAIGFRPSRNLPLPQRGRIFWFRN